MNLTQKILASHLVFGRLEPKEEIAISIDETLTQDSTGTMVYLQFEEMGVSRVKTRAVSYVDHNTLQNGFENADDHRYLRTAARKYGAFFSPAGNGICHRIHLERFAVPGETLLGSDSHTPTAGALGVLAIGAGGLDVAAAMAGEPYYLKMPEVVRVELVGKRPPWVSAKDVALAVLRRLTVKGGVGKILEYGGEGVNDLTVPERATIANMGAETGCTSSIFPSDGETYRFLAEQGRKEDYRPLQADRGCTYDEVITIDLSTLSPLVAAPHSPDNVKEIEEVVGTKVDQVIIGSCTNSSYEDLARAAEILSGSVVHPDTDLVVIPGSRQVYDMLDKAGYIAVFIQAGARILESACGPCIGMGQAPRTDGVSLRTFNRNFKGRSGTPSAQVYLASPEVAAVSAISGEISDPRKLGGEVSIKRVPRSFPYGRIIPGKADSEVKVMRGPNIQPVPRPRELPETLSGEVLLKVGDNITTDDILPGGARVLPLRSNISKLSEYCFKPIDPGFAERARRKNGGFIVAGENYGQGSSREHAALVPMYLGISAVIARSFARIHRANLINFGILPLVLEDGEDYQLLNQGSHVTIKEVHRGVREGLLVLCAEGRQITTRLELTEREREILLSGGLLNLVRKRRGSQ